MYLIPIYYDIIYIVDQPIEGFSRAHSYFLEDYSIFSIH